MQIINDTLIELMLGDPAVCRNLAVFPLFARSGGEPDYLTFDEALERGGATVTEVSEHGSVPELRFTNGTDRRVLLVDGEELVGAKQNRVLNLSILVAAGNTVSIPVSCVEHGRWAWKGRRFSSAKRQLYAGLRAKKMASVTRSLRASNSRRSDQAEVWDDIASKSRRMHAWSATGAMDALYEEHAARIEEFERTALPQHIEEGYGCSNRRPDEEGIKTAPGGTGLRP